MIDGVVNWDERGQWVAADPSATLSVGRAAWEAAGAGFVRADDGDGESPWFATAVVRTSDDVFRVGVVAYYDEITYLLVPRDGGGRLADGEIAVAARQQRCTGRWCGGVISIRPRVAKRP
jgi:hypothetical protein